MIGRRYSWQRELIYRYVKESQAHPTAEMVYNQLRPDHPNLSKGTVYRNLNLLAEEGLLVRMPFSVERYDAMVEPHSHFRCNCCERVFDLDIPYDNTIDAAVQTDTGWQITGHALVFEGLCHNCMEQKNA